MIDTLLRRVRRLVHLVLVLGVGAGVSLLAQYAVGRPIICLRPRGYRHRVYCPRSGSDLRVFYQALVAADSMWRFERPPKLIIDAGANVGMVSLNYARHFPATRIIAIEPDEKNFAMLRLNTEGYSNVHRIQAGLWSRPGWLVIVNPEDEGMSLRVEAVEHPRPGAVPAVTVDQVIRESGFDRADLLKMDIEGAEREVFGTGVHDWLGCVDGLLVELHEGLRPGITAVFEAAIATRPHQRQLQGEYEAVRFHSG